MISLKSMKRILIIDTHALVHRAYHALPPLSDPQGRAVQGVYGFASLLLKGLKELKPDYVVAAFDLPGPTIRHEAFKDYKATRVKTPEDLAIQIPISKDVLRAFNIPVLEMRRFEADDVIGSLVEKLTPQLSSGRLEAVILTGDLDTLQLVGLGVKIYTLRKGLSDTVIYDAGKIKERYAGLKPEQIVDLKALKGDPSDNIPGVPGVGEKTAVVLIKHSGSLKNLYADLENEDKREKLIEGKILSQRMADKLLENRDQAFFSRELARIRRDLPLNFNLKDGRWPNFNPEIVRQQFHGLGFRSLIKRLEGLKGREAAEASLDIKQPSSARKAEQLSSDKDFAAWLRKQAGPYFVEAAKNGNKVIVFIKSARREAALIFNLKPGWRSLRRFLQARQYKKFGWQLKATIQLLAGRGYELHGIRDDLLLAAYDLDPGKREYSLEALGYRYLSTSELRVYSEAGITGLPSAAFRGCLFDLRRSLIRALKQRDQMKLYRSIDVPLIAVLARMEQVGIRVDAVQIEKLAKKISKKRDKLKARVFKLAGTKFNPASPQQLSEILFKRLKLSPKSIRKTKEGHTSTSQLELKKLIASHPIIKDVLSLRELEKILSTYVNPFPGFIDRRTGRIYPHFQQHIAATGRIVTDRPNLQNIPQQGEFAQDFRRSFTAPKNKKIVACDYSQIELRIIASMTGEQKMLAAFKKGEDIHVLTAAEVMGVKPEEVNKKMRRNAKMINFGIIYGLSAHGLAQVTDMNRSEAVQFIERYFNRFPGIKRYIDQTLAEVRQKKAVFNLLGRRRPLPEISSPNPVIRHHAERAAINYPAQSLAADIVKLAMLKIDELTGSKAWRGKAYMVLQIHDEILFEVDSSLAEKFAGEACKLMRQAYNLEARLEVTASSGASWADLQPIET